MSNAPATLTYGRPAPRRRRRVVLVCVAFITTSLIAGGWLYRGPVRTIVVDRYTAWRFARAFDRAAKDLVGGGDLWLAPIADSPPDDRADRHLRALLAMSPGGAVPRPDVHFSLFVRSGRTLGERWLAFACLSSSGLDVLMFQRDSPGKLGREQVMAVPAWWEKVRVSCVLRAIEAHGEIVRASIDIEGGSNKLIWAFDPAEAKSGATGAGALVVQNTVTPLTGWSSPTQWRPVPPGWQFAEGPPPDRALKADGVGVALSFIPDGRIASAGPFRVSLIDPDSDERDTDTHHLPLDLSPSEVFSFSPDGTKLFVGGTSQAAGLVDVTTGRVRRYSRSTSGRARAAFADNKTLLVMDDVQRVRVNWESLRTERLEVGTLGRGEIGAAGDRIVVPESADAVVTELPTKNDVARFPRIQGLQQLSLSPDGRWLAMTSGSDLRLFDVNSGALVWDQEGGDDLRNAAPRVKWAADGLRGAAAGHQWVYVWSLREPPSVTRFPHGLTGNGCEVALSPDGRRMAACARGSGTIAYWADLDEAIGAARAGKLPGAP